MINYLLRFPTKFVNINCSTQRINQKTIMFGWDERTNYEIPGFKVFDIKVESEITPDAFPYGLGVILLKKGKTIVFASSNLTPNQCNYAHIEKELLAVVYGYRKLHPYVYRTRF
ncbi:hypothetical protein AVEN_49724-1 [Araneus ventricosus]|uniref:Reverse transcriptase/retrotransposon-derived protein RNase H-like domain-containing protein n=1 Tax=Araneus ventricosus TaxID=182803 RepID=A0A4Y2FEY2_ARAVE|nr:hypothetical protein AVEN_49724-1 [Araneus ventricosus]